MIIQFSIFEKLKPATEAKIGDYILFDKLSYENDRELSKRIISFLKGTVGKIIDIKAGTTIVVAWYIQDSFNDDFFNEHGNNLYSHEFNAFNPFNMKTIEKNDHTYFVSSNKKELEKLLVQKRFDL